MFVRGKFQAKKLTKRVSDNKVYRKLWIKDEYDEDLQIELSEDILGKLKKDGVYMGTFEYIQRPMYQGYGVIERMILVDVEELKEDLEISGAWEI